MNPHPDRMRELLQLIAPDGQIDVDRIPPGTTIADLRAVRLQIRHGRSTTGTDAA